MQLNNSVQARYTLLRGNKNTDDIGRIIRVNDEPTQNIYKQHEKCNVINGTDKTFFPPFQHKRDTIWVYSHDACISFPLVYDETAFLRGARTAFKNLYPSDPLVRLHKLFYLRNSVKLKHFQMSPDCNCNPYSGCKVPKGTVDLHSCLDIFVLGSLPHFYSADPSIRETLDGLEPKKELHKTGIYFDLVN